MLGFIPPPPHARRVCSDDPDEVTSWVRQRDGDHSRVVHGSGPYGFRVAFLEGRRVNLAWARARLGQTLRARFNRPHLHVPLEAPQQYSFGRSEMSVPVGTPVFLGTGTDVSRRAAPGLVFAVDLDDAALADEVCRRRPGADCGLARFPQALTLSPAQQRALSDAVAGLVQSLAPHVPAAGRDHAEARLIGMLAGALPEPAPRATGRGRLSAQRLANLEYWIEEHIGDPISIGTLCSVAGVGERALQLAFQARRGMSPMRFVAERRLAAVHRRLTCADPGADITSVAIDLGFTHLGRFAVAYRETFGELPSQTLSRSRQRKPAFAMRIEPVCPAL